MSFLRNFFKGSLFKLTSHEQWFLDRAVLNLHNFYKGKVELVSRIYQNNENVSSVFYDFKIDNKKNLEIACQKKSFENLSKYINFYNNYEKKEKLLFSPNELFGITFFPIRIIVITSFLNNQKKHPKTNNKINHHKDLNCLCAWFEYKITNGSYTKDWDNGFEKEFDKQMKKFIKNTVEKLKKNKKPS